MKQLKLGQEEVVSPPLEVGGLVTAMNVMLPTWAFASLSEARTGRIEAALPIKIKRGQAALVLVLEPRENPKFAQLLVGTNMAWVYTDDIVAL